MNQREQPIAIDRKKQDFARWAETRERLDMTRTARQEAIADFILSMVAMAKQLREGLDIRATGFDAEAMPNLEPFLDELLFRIRLHFREKFGRELFDCPPADERAAEQYGPPMWSAVSQTVQHLTDHQAAMLRAASDHFATAQPVPGWPMVIKAHTGDNGFFDSMRRNHPVKLDEIVNGKRVVATHWFHCPDEGDQPVYRLEGEEGYRLASDLAGRITRPSHPAPITPLATDESITQAPTDGGK